MTIRLRHWGLVLAAMLAVGTARAERYTLPGFYSLDVDGWQHRSTPLGEIFACARCDAPVQVQISYGAELPADAEYRTDAQFLGRLDSEDAQRQFAELMMQSSLPPGAEVPFKIDTVRKVHIGGLDALEYVAQIGTSPRASREDAMVALHRQRIMKLSLDFFDEGMSPDDAQRVQALLKSLKFF